MMQHPDLATRGQKTPKKVKGKGPEGLQSQSCDSHDPPLWTQKNFIVLLKFQL